MPESPTVTNILSIDVEDWYQLIGEQLTGHRTTQPQKLAQQIDRLLDLLAKHDTRATGRLHRPTDSVLRRDRRLTGAS